MVRAKQVDDENSSPSLKSESKVTSRRSAPGFSSSSSSIASDASTKKGGKNGKAHNNENADESSTSDDESGEQLELYYSKLQSSLSLSVPPSAGLLCDECGFSHGVLLECQGPCQRVVHQECLGLLENSFEKSNGNKRETAENCFKCEECRTGQHVCFVCKLGYDVEPSQPATRKCAVASCGKFYHDKCVESSELFRKDASWTTNKPAYICPQHACNTCWVDYKI